MASPAVPEHPRHSVRWIFPISGAIVCLLLGWASGFSSMGGDSEWYQNLKKPPGTPPSWVFGPVWTALYLMMGWAAGRLVVRRDWIATVCFIGQLILNLAWTPVFFGAHQIGAALAIIAALWLVLLATIALAAKVDRPAALLLLPYLAWISYASYLNGSFFWLNR